MKTKKCKFVIHPFLFAFYPILYLYAHNVYQLRIIDFLPSALLVVGIGTLLFWLLSFLLKKNKAGIIISLFSIFIFSYGYVYDFTRKIVSDINIYHFYLLTVWIIALFFLLFILLKSRGNWKRLTRFLNIMGTVLIMVPLFNIGTYYFKAVNNHLSEELGIHTKKTGDEIKSEKTLPDIYYIILDGYGRGDVLEEFYSYNNNQFLNQLKEKGFYVADKAKTNYMQTPLSFASSLNFSYLDDLSKEVGKESQDRLILRKLVFENKVSTFLQKEGYEYIHIMSPYVLLAGRNPYADTNIDPESSLNGFEYLLLQTTVFKPFLETISGLNQVEAHAEGILNTFSYLKNIPEVKIPTFIFVHIICPHPPFVFDENGKVDSKDKFFLWKDGSHWMEIYGDKKDYVERYRKQLIFLNKEVISTIDTIMSKSKTPPIVILQGDHGPGSMLEWENSEKTNMKERMSILNAYYLPDGGDKLLYDSITPVNTFRIIFNYYFGTDYEILEDKSYFSTWSHPYDFIEVLKEENNS